MSLNLYLKLIQDHLYSCHDYFFSRLTDNNNNMPFSAELLLVTFAPLVDKIGFDLFEHLRLTEKMIVCSMAVKDAVL